MNDIGPDGRVLLSVDDGSRHEVIGLIAGEARPRNLSYLSYSIPAGLAHDGKSLLMTEFTSGTNYAVCLRKTDGSPAVVLGEGEAVSLAPNAEWALAILHSRPSELLLVPTGAGDLVHIPKAGFEYQSVGAWFPDSKRILFGALDSSKAPHLYTQDVFPPGAPRQLPGDATSIEGQPVSPDGKSIVARSASGGFAIYPVEGGTPRPLSLDGSNLFIGWGSDGRSIYYVNPNGLPGRVYRMQLDSGKTDLVRELAPADPAGVFGVSPVVLAPDGSNIVYGLQHGLYSLQLLDGVK